MIQWLGSFIKDPRSFISALQPIVGFILKIIPFILIGWEPVAFGATCFLIHFEQEKDITSALLEEWEPLSLKPYQMPFQDLLDRIR